MSAQFLTHATTSLYFCSSERVERLSVICKSWRRCVHSFAEGGGTLSRVVFASAMSGSVNAADIADDSKEKLLRQANENYTWRSIMNTGRVRAYMRDACTEHSTTAKDTGEKNKSTLPTQHSHDYSLSDNACQETLSLIVPRLRLLCAECNEKTHKKLGRQIDGHIGSCPIDSPPGRASLRPTVRNQLGQT